MASLEAVHRRREARRLAKRARVRQEQAEPKERWLLKVRRERELASRMSRRLFPRDGSGFVDMPMIALDYRFYQALRAGIDMLCPMVWDGKADPGDTPSWRWWCERHYEERDALTHARAYAVTRRRN